MVVFANSVEFPDYSRDSGLGRLLEERSSDGEEANSRCGLGLGQQERRRCRYSDHSSCCASVSRALSWRLLSADGCGMCEMPQCHVQSFARELYMPQRCTQLVGYVWKTKWHKPRAALFTGPLPIYGAPALLTFPPPLRLRCHKPSHITPSVEKACSTSRSTLTSHSC